VLNNPNTRQLKIFNTTHLNYYIDLVTQISMVSDLEKVTEHVEIVFHYSIVHVHVVVNIQHQLVGAWILGSLLEQPASNVEFVRMKK
jgi:hypothetical protein